MPEPVFLFVNYPHKQVESVWENPRVAEEEARAARQRLFQREKEKLKAQTEAFTAQR